MGRSVPSSSRSKARHGHRQPCPFYLVQLPCPTHLFSSIPSHPMAVNASCQDLYPVASGSTADVCPAAGCKQTHIHVSCPHHLCSKHCVAAGGCTLKTHTALGQLLASQPVTGVSTVLPVEDPANDTVATSSQFLQQVPIVSLLGGLSTSLPAPAMQSNASTVDPCPNPCFVSHIEPIFTQQYGDEQLLLENNWAVEAECQWWAKLAKQSIVIYAWREVHFILMSG